MKTFQEILQEKTDDQLLEALMTCDMQLLRYVQIEWNRRHPEDPIPMN